MTKQFKILVKLCLAVCLLAVVGQLAAGEASVKVKIGEKVPNFTLQDLEGNSFSLSDVKDKVVVMEWTNPSCPFIVRSYDSGLVTKTLAEMKKMGDNYMYVAVNSTARGRSGPIKKQDVVEQNTSFLKSHKIDIPVLVDHDGTVGRMFDARTTPHMYVIDSEGVLRYHGAFTDDRTAKDATATNFVLNALRQIKAGEKVSPDYQKPWGCGVKYAKTTAQ